MGRHPNPLGKFATVIFSAIIDFLTWFIRLITFFGDITVWIAKNVIRSIYLLIAWLNLDKKKRILSFGRRLKALFAHPVISQDRSFKIGLATIVLLVFGVWFATKDLPSPKQLETRDLAQTTKIYDRNGKLLFNIYNEQNRTVVPLSEIPENLKHATIAIEDKDFYRHKGFDIYGIARAARKTLFEGSLQGGSTITQ